MAPKPPSLDPLRVCEKITPKTGALSR